MVSRILTHITTGREKRIGIIRGTENLNWKGKGGGRGLEIGETGIMTETEIAEAIDMIVEITDMTGIEEVTDMTAGGGVYIPYFLHQKSCFTSHGYFTGCFDFSSGVQSSKASWRSTSSDTTPSWTAYLCCRIKFCHHRSGNCI